jgi:hypothetical protein
MADNTETINLAFKADTADMGRAATETEALTVKLAYLRTALNEGMITKRQYNSEVKKTTTELAAATKAADSLGNAVEASSAKQRGMAQAVQGGSRALQDFVSGSQSGGFTGGLNAITNNVEQVGLGFGKLAGLSTETAATLAGFGTVAIVGVQLAVPIVKGLADQFGLLKGSIDPNTTAIEKLTDRIKELNEKKIKFQVDRNELEAAEADLKRLKDGIAGYNELKGLSSKTEKESGSSVKELFEENKGVGRKALYDDEQKKLDNDPLVTQKREALDKLKAKLADAEDRAENGNVLERPQAAAQAFGLKPLVAKATEEAQGAIAKALENMGGAVGDLYKDATDASRGRIESGNKAIADRLDKLGQGGLAGDIRQVSPAGIKENERTNAEMDKTAEENERTGKEATAAGKSRRHKAKENAKTESDDADAAFQALDDSNDKFIKNRKAKEAKAKKDDHAEEAFEKRRNANAQANAKHFAAGGSLDEQAELGLAQGFTPEQVQEFIARALRGAKDAKGNALTPSDIGDTAKAMQGDAAASLNAKRMEATNQIGNAQLADQAVVSDLIAEVSQLQQFANRLQQGNRNNRQSLRNRGR